MLLLFNDIETILYGIKYHMHYILTEFIANVINLAIYHKVYQDRLGNISNKRMISTQV